MGKVRSCLYAIIFVFAALSVTYGTVQFRFSTIYGDHMVLQQAPKRAIVWGYGEIGQRVVVRLNNNWHRARVFETREGSIVISLYKAL